MAQGKESAAWSGPGEYLDFQAASSVWPLASNTSELWADQNSWTSVPVDLAVDWRLFKAIVSEIRFTMFILLKWLWLKTD